MRQIAAASFLVMVTATGTPLHASTLVACHGCKISPRFHLSATSTVHEQRLLADELFRPEHSAAKGLIDQFTTRLLGSSKSGLSIEASRHSAKRGLAVERNGALRDKISVGALAIRLAEPIGDRDIVSIGFASTIEKRRFAFDLANGHMSHSRSLGVEAAWSHGQNWRLVAGYRDDLGNQRGPALERGIELAEGAVRSQAGPWAALSYTIGRPASATSMAFGIKAEALRIADRDRLAMGSPSRSDARIALTASLRFR